MECYIGASSVQQLEIGSLGGFNIKTSDEYEAKTNETKWSGKIFSINWA